jgi:hypothetical protein
MNILNSLSTVVFPEDQSCSDFLFPHFDEDCYPEIIALSPEFIGDR